MPSETVVALTWTTTCCVEVPVMYTTLMKMTMTMMISQQRKVSFSILSGCLFFLIHTVDRYVLASYLARAGKGDKHAFI